MVRPCKTRHDRIANHRGRFRASQRERLSRAARGDARGIVAARLKHSRPQRFYVNPQPHRRSSLAQPMTRPRCSAFRSSRARIHRKRDPHERTDMFPPTPGRSRFPAARSSRTSATHSPPLCAKHTRRSGSSRNSSSRSATSMPIVRARASSSSRRRLVRAGFSLSSIRARSRMPSKCRSPSSWTRRNHRPKPPLARRRAALLRHAVSRAVHLGRHGRYLKKMHERLFPACSASSSRTSCCSCCRRWCTSPTCT